MNPNMYTEGQRDLFPGLLESVPHRGKAAIATQYVGRAAGRVHLAVVKESGAQLCLRGYPAQRPVLLPRYALACDAAEVDRRRARIHARTATQHGRRGDMAHAARLGGLGRCFGHDVGVNWWETMVSFEKNEKRGRLLSANAEAVHHRKK